MGLTHLKFVAFAAHGLDEHRKVEHTAAAHHPFVGVGALFDAQGEVFLQFLLEALVDVARGAEFALFSEEGRVVDGEKHGHSRLVDGDGGQRFGVFEIADGVADLKVLKPDHSTDVAAFHSRDFGATHALKGLELLDFRFLEGAVAVGDGDIHAFAHGAAVHTPDGDAAGVVGIVERGDEQLRSAFEARGSGDVFEDLVQQVVDVFGGVVVVFAHPVVFGRAVNDGEAELLFGGAEFEHEVEHHFIDFLGAAVGFVDFVDDDNGFEADLQGLLQNKARLRHGTLEGVDEQQAAVGHVEHAFHFTAEVGVARSVDDVDLGVPIVDRYVLGKDGDAPLAFQIVVVEHEFAGLLVGAEQVSGQ